MKIVILLSILCSGTCFATNPITSVKMTEDYTAIVELGPGATAKKTLSKGSSFPIVREHDDQIVVSSGVLEIQVPVIKTDLAQQKEEHQKQVAKELALVDQQQKQAAQDKEKEKKDAIYDVCATLVARNMTQQSFVVGANKAAYAALQEVAEKVVAARKSNNPQGESASASEFMGLQKTLLSDPVIGAKYNEVLKEYIKTPVRYNIFENEDQFYLSVGDGNWCTVSGIESNDLPAIIEWLDKSRKWATECFREKIIAKKESPNWGGISLTFNAEDDGKTAYLILDINGPYSSQSLLAHQRVILTILDASRLMNKMVHSEDILKARDAKQHNGQLLN